MTIYSKPTFTEMQISQFENIIDNQILKGNQQICLSTGIVSKDMELFQSYLAFYYPSGSFSPNANFRNYRVAKNGKKYTKKENW
jgi:hypothetical protein